MTVQTEEEEEAQHECDGIAVQEPKDAEAELGEYTSCVPAVCRLLMDVIIGQKQNRRYHEFKCAAKSCKGRSREVRRFLDKKHAKSTSNLRKHAKKCWVRMLSRMRTKRRMRKRFGGQSSEPSQRTARSPPTLSARRGK